MNNKKNYIYLNDSELNGKKTGEYASYLQVINHYCDDLIMNNEIIQKTTEKGFFWDIYNGTDYDEENDCYIDVYQYFIIDWHDAEKLAEHTNELIYYCEELDLYLLGVTHLGTPWAGVETNYKIVTDFSEYLKLTDESENK